MNELGMLPAVFECYLRCASRALVTIKLLYNVWLSLLVIVWPIALAKSTFELCSLEILPRTDGVPVFVLMLYSRFTNT